jgi:hypothetical protein
MARKNTYPSKSSHLQEVVQQYIKFMLSDVSRLMRRGGTIDDKPSDSFLSSDTEGIVIEIGQELKGSTAFRDLYDLTQFLSDSLLHALLGTTDAEKLDIARLAAEIADRLASPLQTFSFSVPLSPRGDLRFSLEIGGEHELKIEYVGAYTNDTMLVSGQVNAATEPSAIEAVEDLIAALLGVVQVLDLCVIAAPLPGSRHSAQVAMTPHETDIPSELSADISAGVAGTLFRVPPKLNDLELKHTEAGQIEKVLERQVRQLRRVMGSADDHAKKLQRAAALLLKASVTRDIELAITYAFTCLEGILLEATKTENVLSRLAEAVAYRIGTSPKHRTELRQEQTPL